MGVADADRLADAAFASWPCPPVRAKVAVDTRRVAGDDLAVALDDDRNEPLVGTEVAGVDHLDAGPRRKGSDIAAGPLHEGARAEEPERDRDPLVSQTG